MPMPSHASTANKVLSGDVSSVTPGWATCDFPRWDDGTQLDVHHASAEHASAIQHLHDMPMAQYQMLQTVVSSISERSASRVSLAGRFRHQCDTSRRRRHEIHSTRINLRGQFVRGLSSRCRKSPGRMGESNTLALHRSHASIALVMPKDDSQNR